MDFTPPQSELKSTLTDVVPEPFGGLKTEYLGQPTFEKFIPEKIETKKIKQPAVKDVATLDIRYIDRKHGLPGNSISTVGRDINGSTAFPTGATLNCYDGMHLTSYFFNDTIGNIKHLSAENSDRLWVSTSSGVYYKQNNTFYALKNNWGTSFWNTSMDQQGILWMSSLNDGVFYIKNDSLFHLIHEDIQLNSREVYADSKGQKWIASIAGVIRLTERDTVIFRLSQKDRQPVVFKEFGDKLYVGLFMRGIRVIENDQVWNLDIGIETQSVWDMEVTPTGLWFTVYNNGLWLIRSDGDFHRFSVDEGLAGYGAHKISIDDFGNIWVAGFSDGLSIFSEVNFLVNESLAIGSLISDIKEIPGTDTTWFLYAAGTPIRKIGEQYFQMDIDDKFAEINYNYTASFEHGDKGWLQGFDWGFIKYENNAFYTYEYSDDPYEIQNNQPSVDKHGRVWGVNYRKELRYLKNDSIYLAFQKKNLGENIFSDVNQLLTDKQKEFYFSRRSDVHWVAKETLFKHAFEEEIVKYTFEHEIDGIWVLTDKRLYHLQEDKVLQTIKYGYSEMDNISSALHRTDTIYLVTTDDLWFLKLEKNGVIADKLQTNKSEVFSNIFSLQDELLFTSVSRSYRFNSWWNAKQSYLPKLNVQNVVVDEKEVNSKKFQFEQNEQITVKLEYLDWGKNSLLQYKLKKDKQEADWTTISDNHLSFDNLSSGDYKLLIRAGNQSKEWVNTHLAFSVNPFWYQTRWFFLSIIATILISFYFIYRYRIDRAKAMELKLKKAVNLKTIELASEKKQVEQQLQQKELLLKEINHRVMNNMQMVSSILELQFSKTLDGESRENLVTARDRIKALALAHQHLYKNEEYETIRVREYLSVVEKSLKMDKMIRINMDIHPDLILPIERAQSLGLVLNELISNSIKHAWNGNRTQKQIDVELIEDEMEYTWKYSDNGQGLKNAELNNKGLGVQLIGAITTRQLSGELEFVEHDGFKLKIKFPKS